VRNREELAPTALSGDNVTMFEVVAIIVVLVVAIPVGFLMSGAVAAAILGGLVKADVDHSHAGSELLETNR
jgi:hypothetical protein